MCEQAGQALYDEKRKYLLPHREEIIVNNFTTILKTLVFNHKNHQQHMFRKLRDLYREYKPYVRVDLIMYASLILMIILYFIISTVLD